MVKAKHGTIAVASAFAGHKEGKCIWILLAFLLHLEDWPNGNAVQILTLCPPEKKLFTICTYKIKTFFIAVGLA